MTIQNVSTFLNYFPVVDPPVILALEEVTTYSRENQPFSQGIIQEVFIPFENENENENLVEFIPCFQLPSSSKIHIVVYYRGDLFINEYHILTLNNNGNVIDRKAIAGTYIVDDELIRYVASIDEYGLIRVVIGSNEGRDEFYNPLKSQTITYEIAPDGTIIQNNNTDE